MSAWIRGFKGTFADAILRERRLPKGFPVALAVPPGNRLEALKGDLRLRGKHSIRINDQWRIVFRWAGAGREEVEIVDYH